jgi:hypothetical protein
MRLAAKHVPAFPASINYAPANVVDWGMFLNDQLGDCTCAAFYHALQIWSLGSNKPELTESDASVLALYEKATGYNPADPSTDQGGVEQNVLTYTLKSGAPMDGGQVHKISAFYEVDPRNTSDVKQTIFECGLAYIGFDVPQNLMPDDGETPSIWTVEPDQEIIGGHAIILTGYDSQGLDLISWGAKYRMTWEFFATYVDEVYGIADPEWIKATGQTPCGLTLQQLEQLMQAL